MKCMTLAAVAALSAMSCTDGFAGATASATLSDLKVTLTDLAPGDGIAPSVTFGQQDRAYSSLALPAGGGQLLQDAFGTNAFDNLSTAVNAPLEDAYARIAGDVYGAGATLSVGSDAYGPHAPSSSAFILVGGFETMTLAPATEVTISGVLDLLASTTDYDAVAGAQFSMTILAGPDTTQSFYTVLLTSPLSNTPYRTLEQVQAESMSFVNTTSAPITALFSLQLSTVALATTAPEPANAALMLAGLAGLVAWKRRRA